MAICTVCGCAYLPTGRWREDWCLDCHTYNFAASEELRVHDAPATDAQREAQHQHYEAECRAAYPPTPRQVEAMRRVMARWCAESEGE